MTTIKAIYRDSANGSGDGALYYRVIHRRRMRQVHTGQRITHDEWDEKTGTVVIGTDGVRSEYLKTVNDSLRAGQKRFAIVISSLEKSGKDFTVDDVVERYMSPDTAIGFLSFARRLIADLRQMGKNRCSDHYTTALNSFIRFNGDIEVPFEEFDGNLMQRYECHLKSMSLIPNSISYYMRNLRAIYNKAVEKGMAEQTNPFKHVYTGIAKTVKRAVSLPVVKAIRALDLRGAPQKELARDMFLFSFYTRGMAFIDMAHLKKNDLKDGILSYRRQKTGQQLHIRWEPQMQEIAARHGIEDSEFLFPLIDSGKPDFRKQYLAAYARLKRHLKELGKQLGLTESLTFHRSRHAWASIARANNVPLSVICEGMGHDSEKTTRIYLASLDTSVVDNANSDIISLLDK